MIPVIMKGETSKPIQLALKEGYEYSGCALHVNFCGLRDTFVDLAAGGSVELRYTAEQTARLPLGTSKVMLSIENARNEICFMPWAKIKVTDCPEDVRDAQVTIDPATLNVDDLTAKDSLASVKSRLNAVLAFLRGLSSLAVLALPLYALSDVAPLTAPLDDIPGDTPLMTNVVSYVDAKVAAIPGPDYSTGNTQLVATIEAKAPAPGNYAAVSNRAMSALQSHQSLAPATNYTDAALGAFASTGTVARATVYGTPTRWTDADGGVWEVSFSLSPWSFSGAGVANYSNLSVGENEDIYVLLDNGSFVDYGSEFGSDLLEVHFAYAAVVATRSIVPSSTIIVGRVALTNDIPDMSGYATQRQSTNAAVAVADAKISTNNAAFVSAVLAVPIAGADAGDLAELAEYGGYGTVSAAILALIAGLAAIKKRVTSAETALAQKASLTDLPYRLVTPGEWTFSGSGYDPTAAYSVLETPDYDYTAYQLKENGDIVDSVYDGITDALSVNFDSEGITATRASLPGHLLDRSGNRVVVTGDMTLTLPEIAHAGRLRDFLVRLEISGSTVPTITFAAPTGETITYETDGDEFPVPDEAGDWLYSFTESCVAHKFAVSLKKVNEVAQGGA